MSEYNVGTVGWLIQELQKIDCDKNISIITLSDYCCCTPIDIDDVYYDEKNDMIYLFKN